MLIERQKFACEKFEIFLLWWSFLGLLRILYVTFADNGPYSQSYSFSSSDVQMWKLDHREHWAPKNRCFQIRVLEKTLQSPFDCKEIKPVNHKGNQHWVFIKGLLLQLNEIVGWLHQFDGYDIEQTLRESGRQRSLVCCSPWDCEESDTV